MRQLLPLPVAFDANEWFILISDLVFLFVFLRLPKRFPRAVIVMILLFNCALSKTADYTLAASLPFNFYNYNDTAKLELFDAILHFTLYPLVAYLVMYGWDVWRAHGLKKIYFLLIAASLSTFYEWLSDLAHVFTYKGWHLYYSAMAYVILIWINTFYLTWLKKWLGVAE